MKQVVLPRSAWTKWKPKASNLVPMHAPAGFVVHWPGTKVPRLNSSKGAIAKMLESERRDHVVRRGWSDIAYQAGVDNAGRIWDLRGVGNRPAANGDRSVNTRWGAVTCLLGAQEAPTREMIDAVRYFRQEIWLPRYPEAVKVVGHRDVWATGCPGPFVYKLVKSGEFYPSPSSYLEEEEDMPALCVKPAGPAEPGDGYLVVGASAPGPVVSYEHYEMLVDANVVSPVREVPRDLWAKLKLRVPVSAADEVVE